MAILDVDAKRAATISVPNALMLLVAPPTSEALGQLVRAAAGPKDKEADIVARIAAASAELARCQVSGRCLGGAWRCLLSSSSRLHDRTAGALQGDWQHVQSSLVWVLQTCVQGSQAPRLCTLQSKGLVKAQFDPAVQGLQCSTLLLHVVVPAFLHPRSLLLMSAPSCLDSAIHKSSPPQNPCFGVCP